MPFKPKNTFILFNEEAVKTKRHRRLPSTGATDEMDLPEQHQSTTVQAITVDVGRSAWQDTQVLATCGCVGAREPLAVEAYGPVA